MPPLLLTNFEVQKYHLNENKFSIVYSINNLTKVKDGLYVINLDEFKSIGTHWITLCVNGINRRASYDAIYFDSLGVEHIPKEIKKFRRNKNIIINIYRIQACDLKKFRYSCIGFINFMLKGKSLLNYTKLFSPNDSEKNNTNCDKIILKYFE